MVEEDPKDCCFQCCEMHMDDVPRNVKEVLNSEDRAEWTAAIEKEIRTLMLKETWEVVHKQDGVKYIKTKLHLVNKYNDNGEVVRRKARLVVRGDL